MKLPRWIRLIFTVGMCVCAIGCQNECDLARKALAEEIATRQARQVRSQERYNRGLKAYREEDSVSAHRYFSEAVSEDDRNVYAWIALGVLEYERDRLFEAAHAFHRAARLEPKCYEPHYNIGLVFESVEKYDQAIEPYEKAYALAPNNAEVMENLARCYIKSDQHLDKARRLIMQARAIERRPEWCDWLDEQYVRLVNKEERMQ